MRSRRDLKSLNKQELPVMCSGCNKFIAKGYRARHQFVCSGNRNGSLVLTTVSINNYEMIQALPKDFQELLSTLRIDEVSDMIKSDQIILMIGKRSHYGLRRKKDKIVESKKTVRSRMRLTAQ